VLEFCGTVSKTRAIAINSALLFVCAPGHLSDRFLGSFGAHHTPMPAVALRPPFPLHAPSEYTISTVVFLGAAILRGWTILGAGVGIAVDMDWGTGREKGVVNWFRGV